MVKLIAAGVAIAVGAVLAFAATRPDRFHVERSLRIAAPAAMIYPLIDTLPRWRDWSPYEKLDPAMQRSFSGPESGLGAAYAWDGKGDAGAGRMEIVEATPAAKLVFKLDFTRPFEGHNLATFTLSPDGDATRVNWAMDGPNPYIAKLLGLFFDMDHMIGRDFETGLASLKSLSEKPAETDAAAAPN